MIYPKKGAMVKPCISIVVDVEGFALCKDDLRPFCSHHVVFEATVEYFISVSFLVQVV
jgi:hypothetical protein